MGCPCQRDPKLESGPELQLLSAPSLQSGSSSAGQWEHPMPEGAVVALLLPEIQSWLLQSPDVAEEAAEE